MRPESVCGANPSREENYLENNIQDHGFYLTLIVNLFQVMRTSLSGKSASRFWLSPGLEHCPFPRQDLLCMQSTFSILALT